MAHKRKSVRLTRDLPVNGRKQKKGDWVMVDEKTANRWLANGMADEGLAWDEKAGKNHVLMVSSHCCTRVQKQAAALKALGWRVDSVSKAMPGVMDGFDVLKVTQDEKEFPAIIESSGASIIHVHNEPDRLMQYADAGANGRPIVYDCHDLGWYRTFSVLPEERFAFDRADGIINVSKEHRDLAYKLHPWKVPEAITMSVPMKAWMPQKADDEAGRHGVVYEGGSNPGASEANRFRDHIGVDKAFEAAGIDMTFFVPTRAIGAYRRSRMFVPYKVLLDQLATFKWGFIGTDVKTDKGDVCLPNKTFDYLLAGLPLLCCNVPAVETFMEGKAGIYAKDMKTLIEKMQRADWYKLHEEAKAARRFMDDEIKHTLMVYDALLGTFECPFCGKSTFKSNLGLQGHMKSSHPEEYKAMREQ
jgi:hypothetical protein